MKNITADQLIEYYKLIPHPEGGFYKETYRSKWVIDKDSLPKTFTDNRFYYSAIYFLLVEGSFSRLHRLKSDEIWHFYLGGPLTLIQIDLDGKVTRTLLGEDAKKGEEFQYFVSAGCWFGAYPNKGSEYSFVGCTCVPGFEFDDFELADKAELLKLFPHARKEIDLLTL